MNGHDRFEERLTRLLGASRAKADPAVLARALARLEAGERTPAFARWAGRPVVLAGSCALFVFSVAACVAWTRSEPAPTAETSVVGTLLGDDGTYGLPTGLGAGSGAGMADSGEVTL